MGTTPFDRTAQDVGNILALEHVNLTVPDQQVALLFYVCGLGLTRDPHMMVGLDNMWVNVGRQQLHLPTRERPQRLSGHIGLVLMDLDALKTRLAGMEGQLAETAFKWEEEEGYIAVTGPWGNRFRCYGPHPRFGSMVLGIPYVEFLVPAGIAEGVGRFYQEILRAPAAQAADTRSIAVRVSVGLDQALVFREAAEEALAYDGHHIAVYLANFSRPHRFLKERGLVTEETDAYQYRFVDVVDPETGQRLLELEHEVRSLHHPMFQRGLVNRNAAQRIGAYTRGRDALPA